VAEVDQVRGLQTRSWRYGGRSGPGESPTDKDLEDMVAEVDQVRDLQKRSWRIWWQRWTR
jgi:hypothetical protein